MAFRTPSPLPRSASSLLLWGSPGPWWQSPSQTTTSFLVGWTWYALPPCPELSTDTPRCPCGRTKLRGGCRHDPELCAKGDLAVTLPCFGFMPLGKEFLKCFKVGLNHGDHVPGPSELGPQSQLTWWFVMDLFVPFICSVTWFEFVSSSHLFSLLSLFPPHVSSGHVWSGGWEIRLPEEQRWAAW